MRRLLYYILIIQISVCQAATSPVAEEKSWHSLAMRNAAVDTHPEYLARFTQAYDRTSIDHIGFANVIAPQVVEAIVTKNLQAHPDLNKVNTEILRMFIRRTALTLMLSKNGYVDAAARELEYLLGETGELVSAVDAVYSKKYMSAEVTEDVIQTTFLNLLEQTMPLPQVEKQRIANLLEQSKEQLQNKKFLKKIGKLQRKTFLNANYYRKGAGVVASFVVFFVLIVSFSYFNRIHLISGQLVELMNFFSLYAWGGVETVLVINLFRDRLKLLQPWTTKKMAAFHRSCTNILRALNEGY